MNKATGGLNRYKKMFPVIIIILEIAFITLAVYYRRKSAMLLNSGRLPDIIESRIKSRLFFFLTIMSTLGILFFFIINE
ncbi:hypothetical protein GCM10023149_37690 [Mucilaginibacter gynuensis]|uniref:Uncharacterized protein n=1 Tax=Mucilaginibacter gynuensis TaxID=1302236 RepID=A0ABP8GYC0_9SPHI